MKVVRLEETEVVSFGPGATYRPIIGDDAGSTPVRTGVQTSEPGYQTGVHSHPYLEILFVLEGVAQAWVEGQEDRPVTLRAGDTLALPAGVPHAFRVVGDQTLRTLGIHASPTRIVHYREPGRGADARGYPVVSVPGR
jgi:mannose-6-phosphate isomerase-like protein (cupin superfamily)